MQASYLHWEEQSALNLTLSPAQHLEMLKERAAYERELTVVSAQGRKVDVDGDNVKQSDRRGWRVLANPPRFVPRAVTVRF